MPWIGRLQCDGAQVTALAVRRSRHRATDVGMLARHGTGAGTVVPTPWLQTAGQFATLRFRCDGVLARFRGLGTSKDNKSGQTIDSMLVRWLHAGHSTSAIRETAGPAGGRHILRCRPVLRVPYRGQTAGPGLAHVVTEQYAARAVRRSPREGLTSQSADPIIWRVRSRGRGDS